MPKKTIEVRAGMDADRFYVGYNPNPGNKALAKSVLNRSHYEPSPKAPYVNDDGSVTLQFSKFNLGFDEKERYINFSGFIHETVVPQLAEAVEVEVVAPDEIMNVALDAGKMSLFAADVQLAEVR